MTKIDETKQYKFSEIVRMVEDRELPEGTELVPTGHVPDKCLVKRLFDGNLGLYPSFGSTMPIAMFGHYLRKGWTIQLPKEDKYLLRVPVFFGEGRYLNYSKALGNYTFNTKYETHKKQTQFTQSEIDAMPFDTNFFGEPINVEDE